MLDRPDLIYRYDGSFEGLMCCVYESFYKREMPLSIISREEAQQSLFEAREIVTDNAKAARVMKAVKEKISGEAMRLVYRAYLTDLRDREVHILRFLVLGFKCGAKVLKMLTDDRVAILYKAVTRLGNEAELLRGFVRFSDFGGGLVATIEPKNSVLPLLKHHFMSRYPGGSFIIYDKTHRLALVVYKGQSRIVQADDFVPPSPEMDELRYRAMWKRFYNTIAVEGRENPKCRMSHMPKRYWAHLTEMQEISDSGRLAGDDKAALKSVQEKRGKIKTRAVNFDCQELV